MRKVGILPSSDANKNLTHKNSVVLPIKREQEEYVAIVIGCQEYHGKQ